MSITKSFNRHTNTWYAYETTYVWDESRQKKVQKRKCIGKVDPVTNQIVQNGRRGRPRITPEQMATRQARPDPRVDKALARLASVRQQLAALTAEIDQLEAGLRQSSGETL